MEGAIITEDWWVFVGVVVKVTAEVETTGPWLLLCGSGERFWCFIAKWLAAFVEVIRYGNLGVNWPEGSSLVQKETRPMEMIPVAPEAMLYPQRRVAVQALEWSGRW